MENFKDIEPTDLCPPHIQEELVSEIDSIRNSLQIAELYIGDFLSVISSLFASPVNPPTDHE
ncbi:MAG: hypothetical protein LH609_16445 [Rudanella sp.]|nr:hypothetical protein [Rudanella sp.]